MSNNMYGFIPGATVKYTPAITVAGEQNALAYTGEFVPDVFLPVLATDQIDPNKYLVIPAGRFIATGTSTPVATSNKRRIITNDVNYITPCNGKDTNPIGISINHIYRRGLNLFRDGYNQTVKRNLVVEVPITNTVNFGLGEMMTTDRVAPNYGPAPIHTGKPVKWLAKTTKTETFSAAATHNLVGAPYVGVVPDFVSAFTTAGALLPSVVCTFSYDTGNSNWLASFTGTGSATVATVVYQYGHGDDKIAGDVWNIKSLSQYKSENPLYAFVTNGEWFDQPMFTQQRDYTNVTLSNTADPGTGETPATVTAGSVYRVANFPMSVLRPVTIYVQGTVSDVTGNLTTYSGSNWFQLTNSQVGWKDLLSSFAGDYYQVNPETGLIYIDSNITLTAIRVTYSYLSDAREGAVMWGPGFIGLTDGASVTPSESYGGVQMVPPRPTGIPAHLNYKDVIGGIQIFVY